MTEASNDSWRTWTPEAKAELRWRLTARPNQLPPDGDWYVWLILAGRGWGKTRTGAEWARRKALSQPGIQVSVIAPTSSTGRNVCFEGPAGLRSVIPDSLVRSWNRSMGELFLTNGSVIRLFTAEQPERLRGENHRYVWADELAAWDYADEAWEQMMLGLRIGEPPRVVITTTPKPIRLIRDLLKQSTTHVTTGSTFENEKNLSAPALAELRRRYEGTRLGRQELYAEVIDDVEGALWTRQMLEDAYVSEHPQLKRVVVGVDPTGGVAEAGIVVAGLGRDGHGYVLADVSGPGTPNEWAGRAVDAYHTFNADRIVAEPNYGGAMVENVIRMCDKNVSLRLVTSSRGKQLRAEPVAALYEQNRVHHVGRWPKLEDQMTSWTPDDKKSPDRLDALVFALSELMVSGRSRPDVGPSGVSGESGW